MRATQALAAAAVVAVAAALAAPASAQGVGSSGFLQCFSLGLDTDFAGPPPAGENYWSLNRGPGAAILAGKGVTVTARRYTSSAQTTLAPTDAAVFDTSNPVADDDLGSPNRGCGYVDTDVPGASPYCWTETAAAQADPLLSPAPLGSLFDSFPGQSGSDVDYVDCAVESCPGNGCGGGRYEATDETKNDASGSCDYILREVQVFLAGGGATTVMCPVFNLQANCAQQGNVFVIQEAGPNLNAAGLADDEAFGGIIDVVFDQPVSPETINVVDIDFVEETGSEIIFFREDGTEQDRTTLIDPGNNGFEADLVLGSSTEIKRIEIRLAGSGSIDDFQWCVPGGDLTTTPEWNRTCEWDITKDVDPAEHLELLGNAGTSTYTVNVTKECTDTYRVCAVGAGTSPRLGSLARVSSAKLGLDPSSVTTNNFRYEVPLDLATDCQCRSDTADEFGACTIEQDGTVLVSGQCGSTEACEIRCSACSEVDGPAPLAARFRFATLQTNPDDVGTFFVSGSAQFGAGPDNLVDDCASVSDSDGLFATFDTCGPVSNTYDRDFACEAKEQPPTDFSCTSTVTAADTGAESSDGASVRLTCVDPEIAKEGAGSFRRSYSWSIDKSGSSPDERVPMVPDCTEIVFGGGLEEAAVDYAITVTATPTDDNYAASGTITVTNPHPEDTMTGASITDAGATLDCPFDPSNFDVAPQSSVVCNWSVGPSDTADPTENTATLGFNGFACDASTGIDYGTEPGEVLYDTAAVTDSFEGGAPTELGQLTATGATAEDFVVDTAVLRRTFAPEECTEDSPGEIEATYVNEATVTWEAGSDTDSWKVTTKTPCEICPCEYDTWPPAGQNPMDDYCTEVSGPPSGVCLCWQGPPRNP